MDGDDCHIPYNARTNRIGIGPDQGSFRDTPGGFHPACALKCRMGKGALVGIVASESVASMEGTIRQMTNAKLTQMPAAVLIAGLVTAGAGAMGYSAILGENPPSARVPRQEARQPVAAAQMTPGPARAAATKPATDQVPLMIQVAVVDADGRRLSGADVAVKAWYSRGSGETEPVLKRTTTDVAGHAQVEVARERPGAKLHHATFWAYQSGRAFATTSVLLTGMTPPAVIPMTLGHPAKWTITVLGPDDRPIAGVRLAPRLLRRTNIFPLAVPDELLEPLTVTTDDKGTATLTNLPETMVLLSIRLAGPGVAPHTQPVDASRGKDVVLKLGRPGRMVGIVRSASGVPLVGVPVELWVQGSGTLPTGVRSGRGDQRITPDEIVHLDPKPLKTGPQGAFQTPSTLVSGSSYRVSIRHDGFVPFVSDWVTLNGERASIPPIRLQPLQKLTGQIKDRQGRAIAGARVFVPAGGPAMATDAEGQFVLAGIGPRKTFILVEQEGFRLHGWLVNPSSQAELGSLTLVRAGETPGPLMKPLADLIPLAESRALAYRLLEPYLHDAVENDDDEPKPAAISALSEFDLDRALDLLHNGNVREEYQGVRGSLAVKLADKDPARPRQCSSQSLIH